MMMYMMKTYHFNRGKTMSAKEDKRCADCRDEGQQYNDNVQTVNLRERSTGRLERRAALCSEHREMYYFDGYRIEHGKGKRP